MNRGLFWGISLSLILQVNLGVSDDHKADSLHKYSRLRNAIDSIRSSCGEICDTSEKSGTYQRDHSHFVTRRKKVNCVELFQNSDIERPSEFSYPPLKIPKYLIPEFLYNGRVEKRDFHLDSDFDGESHLLDWSMSIWDLYFQIYEEGRLSSPYGQQAANEIKRFLSPNITEVRGCHVLIIGSQSPWIETIALKAGAKHVTTLDYVKINNEHPQVTTLTPDVWATQFLNGNLPRFDLVISFSSLEHSGLGRYGDALNPWGDLITMAKAWCVLKPEGKALVGVPAGVDMIEYNAHRIYGPLMFSHLFANWKLNYSELNYDKFNEHGCSYCYQPLLLLNKITT